MSNLLKTVLSSRDEKFLYGVGWRECRSRKYSNEERWLKLDVATRAGVFPVTWAVYLDPSHGY